MTIQSGEDFTFQEYPRVDIIVGVSAAESVPARIRLKACQELLDHLDIPFNRVRRFAVPGDRPANSQFHKLARKLDIPIFRVDPEEINQAHQPKLVTSPKDPRQESPNEEQRCLYTSLLAGNSGDKIPEGGQRVEVDGHEILLAVTRWVPPYEAGLIV